MRAIYFRERLWPSVNLNFGSIWHPTERTPCRPLLNAPSTGMARGLARVYN